MPKCRGCVHWEVCREYVTRLAAARGVDLGATELEQIFDSDDCDHFHDSSRFVELPFTQSKGASPFDKIAHTAYTLATEGRHLVGNTIEGLSRYVQRRKALYYRKRRNCHFSTRRRKI